MAIAIAAAFSTVQVFVLPRRLDLESYGHYRRFLVYVTYLELFNAGIADGAFLRWAGRGRTAIAREWRVIGRWLLGTQFALLCAALAGAVVMMPGIWRLYLVAFACAALCVNAQLLSSYAMQAAGDFRTAGRIAVLGPGLFVVVMLLAPVHTLAPVLAAYVAALAVAAVYAGYSVATVTTPPDHGDPSADAGDAPRAVALIRSGAPVLLAGVAAVLSRSVDRILASAFTPITSFARYGFAATVMVTANVATQALSRVALSHAARKPAAERAAFLDGFFYIIAAGYGVALAAEPLFEQLVTHYLPPYIDGLPILRALLLSLPLTTATHVVLVGTLQSYARVRRQLAVQLCGVGFALVTCGTALAMHLPLWIVGAAATSASGATFLVGVAIVRHAVPQARALNAPRFVGIVAFQSAALLVALTWCRPWMRQVEVYMLLAALPTTLAALRARARGW